MRCQIKRMCVASIDEFMKNKCNKINFRNMLYNVLIDMYVLGIFRVLCYYNVNYCSLRFENLNRKLRWYQLACRVAAALLLWFCWVDAELSSSLLAAC